MSIPLSDYIASRYGVHHGAQKEFLADNTHMTNSEVSRWTIANWRVDLATGSLFKESNKKVSLKEPKYDVISSGELIHLDYTNRFFYTCPEDATKKQNAVAIKAVVEGGFLTIDKESMNIHNAPVLFNASLWNEDGIELKIVDKFVIAERSWSKPSN